MLAARQDAADGVGGHAHDVGENGVPAIGAGDVADCGANVAHLFIREDERRRRARTAPLGRSWTLARRSGMNENEHVDLVRTGLATLPGC